MRRLAPPAHNAWELTQRAASKFPATPLEAKVVAARPHLEAAYMSYQQASVTASWYTLASCNWGSAEQVIVGGLTKGELKELYTSGVVSGVDDARNVYDKIFISSDGQCPYCAGIGHVGTLDHFLPKSLYPAYSVLPINLIPCCEKCNKLSGSPIFACAEDQAINPYYDDPCYFEDRWVNVVFDANDILSYRYVFDPPSGWTLISRARAYRHFRDFSIATRYGTAASGEIGFLNDLKNSMRGICSQSTVRALLETKANCDSFDLNGWQRPLYRTVSSSNWFLDLF